MARHVGDYLEQRARESFVGRSAELAYLLEVLKPTGPFVQYVHGIGGIGKTTLLDAFADEARQQGATIVRINCREIEPSARGFLAELSRATGGRRQTVEAVTGRLGQLDGRVVLALDTYEVFRLMDTWMRRVFIPALPDNVRVLLVGREPPVAAWRIDPGWEGLFRCLRLEPLTEGEAVELLAILGLDAGGARRINSFARGHPLALRLAAAAAVEQPDLRWHEIASQHVIAELTRLYLADVPDAQTRLVLEAASVLRRVTRSLLGALLPDAAPQDSYDRLERLPFVETGSDGLILHDVVRQAIATNLEAADPSRWQGYRLAAYRQLRRELRTASATEIWRYTADLLYMIEEPIIREAFFPSDDQPYAVDPAHEEDSPAILRIAAANEGPQAVEALARWRQRAPQTFRLIRNRQGEIDGFYVVMTAKEIDPSLFAEDPLLAKWWQHLQYDPIPRDQTAVFCRRWLAAEEGELPSGVQAASWLDLKSEYVAHRATLRRVYCTAINVDVYAPVLVKLGFSLVPEAAVELDGQTYQTALLDFGPGLFGSWMDGHVRSVLGIERTEILDREARELVLDGERVSLTPLEYGVMAYLCDHTGKAVSREELLDQVWGYDYLGGSNVVDARVSSLRGKLGKRAAMIETVSGVGYRWREGQAPAAGARVSRA